jgi:acyl transferase domain-containing protein/acyl carrier protein
MTHPDPSSLPDEPIALIGIGCLFANGIDSPAALWSFLLDGGDAISEVPADHWNASALFDPDPGAEGKTYSRHGGFLQDQSGFDANFFGISPREAATMDPQHRLLLEVSWRAIEDAGLPAERLAGSRTGVYVGISSSDYSVIQKSSRRLIDVHTITGGALSLAANRLSHRFDLRGPSLVIDTACSSSLVALDAARTALLSRECDLALVGGVNAVIAPETTISFSRASMLSPDGRCKAFSAHANGYVRGEGAAIVVLKRLSDAKTDRIRALITGTFVNQDGHTSTITVPSRDAQIAMLRGACRRAGVDPQQIAYVEAHGTGTAVGDPIEAEAIGTVFGTGRSAESPCLIGSIKTNIGHLEPAAGIAGLIKAALCVQQGEIPASLHCKNPHPSIPFTRLGIRVASERRSWPRRSNPRVAAVNSFGFGGTNACAIVQEAPRRKRPAAQPKEERFLLPLSAATKTALATMCVRLADLLDCGEVSLPDVAFTLAHHRTHLDHRIVVPACTVAEASERLRAAAAGTTQADIVSGRRVDGPRIVFLFTGQGSQWWGMARNLLKSDKTFSRVVRECDEAFSARSGWSLLKEMTVPESRSGIDRTVVAQPALFALQAGLAACLGEWGIKPDAVIGHSIGEIGAAFVAGALSLEQAIECVYHRSALQERARARGSMAALGMSATAAQELLEDHPELEIAAINAPKLVTIAGPRAVLKRFVEDMGIHKPEVFCEQLRVDYAFHSRQMDPFVDELRSNLAALAPSAPRIPMFSTVTGELVGPSELDADYWCRNMRQPVLFANAVEAVVAADFDTFVELGPHPVLSGMLRARLTKPGRDSVAIATLRREEPDESALAVAFARLHVRGIRVDWTAKAPKMASFVELPGYPWQKQPFWRESEESRSARLDAPAHPLLGICLKSAKHLWQTEVGHTMPRYLADHRIGEAIVFPAAGYVELMLAAAKELLGDYPWTMESITFDEALILEPNNSVFIETSADDRGFIRISSCPRGEKGPWTQRASAFVRRWLGSVPSQLQCWPANEPSACVDGAVFYQHLTREGHQYGPTFQGVRRLSRENNNVLGEIELPKLVDSRQYFMHPALLDACFQLLRGFADFDQHSTTGSVIFPVGIERIRWFRRPTDVLRCRASGVSDSVDEIFANLTIIDQNGEIVAEIERFRCRRLHDTAKSEPAFGAALYCEQWQQLPSIAPQVHSIAPQVPNDVSSRCWLILADRSGLGERTAQLLAERDQQTILAYFGNQTRQIGPDRYEVSPTSSDFKTIMEARGVTDIVQAWMLDSVSDPTSAASIEAMHHRGAWAVIALAQALHQLEIMPRLSIVTSGSVCPGQGHEPVTQSVSQAALIGVARALANEMAELHPRVIDLDPAHISADSLVSELLSAGTETEVAWRGGVRFGCRLVRTAASAMPWRRRHWNPKTRLPACKVTMSRPGVIDNLLLAQVPVRSPGPNEVLVETCAVGLNFRDIMAATNLLPTEAEGRSAWRHLGLECSGIVRAVGEGVSSVRLGERVVALGSDCLASHVVVPADLAIPLPQDMDFQLGASIPTAYATARYSLVTLARLSAGEQVLIHAATGGVGLAAISIARSLGANVIATAGNEEKRAYLRELGVKHVLDSRTLAFVDEVRTATDGRGVDVVLNSLSGPFLEGSLSLLASGGRFVEIGKRDIYTNTEIGLRVLRHNGAFFVVDLARLAIDRPDLLRSEIQAVFDDLSKSRTASLHPVRTFPVGSVADAFRHMARAHHIGKVVISFDDPSAMVEQCDESARIVDPDATYLITGGTRGLGLAIGSWLVRQGASSLVLVGRSSPRQPEAAQIEALRTAGASITVVSADIGSIEGARRAVQAAMSTGKPLRGLFHAAGLVDSTMVKDLDRELVWQVFAGKVLGAWHLHELTSELSLDYFVCCSSAAAVLGPIGQSHYAAANRALDAIAAFRRMSGLPGLSINFGPIADAGYLVSRPEVANYLAASGVLSMQTETVLDALGTILRRDPGTVMCADINWSRIGLALSSIGSAPRTAAMARSRATNGGVRGLLAAASQEERTGMVADYLREQVSAVLKIAPESIEIDRPLSEFGLDSLTSFELKNRLEEEIGVVLPIGKFLQRPTISHLGTEISERLEAVCVREDHVDRPPLPGIEVDAA